MVLIFPPFGIPFILIGIGLLTAPVRIATFASSTAYVHTDKRALIFHKSRSKVTIKDYLPKDLAGAYREEDEGQGGSIIFFQAQDNEVGTIPGQSVGFLGIDNVGEVESLVKELARKARTVET